MSAILIAARVLQAITAATLAPQVLVRNIRFHPKMSPSLPPVMRNTPEADAVTGDHEL